MHQYKIEIFNYTESGSVGSLLTVRYADDHEQAKLICSEYDNVYQTTIDEEGNEIRTNMKAYQVRLHLLCYKLCQDRNAFFAQFQA